MAADTRNSLEQAHAAAEPQHDSFDFDDVAGANGTAITNALDAGEEGQALAVFRFGENQNRADLRNALGEDGRRQHRRSVSLAGHVPLVVRDVLDTNDAL